MGKRYLTALTKEQVESVSGIRRSKTQVVLDALFWGLEVKMSDIGPVLALFKTETEGYALAAIGGESKNEVIGLDAGFEHFTTMCESLTNKQIEELSMMTAASKVLTGTTKHKGDMAWA